MTLRRADEEEDEKEDKSPRPDPQSSEIAKALYKSRTVLIFGEVDMKMAERVTAQLLAYAESEGDIRVIVNSPGGHVESGDTIHDMIRFVGNRVKMIGTGWVASAGAHIFLGAKKENRFCLPFTRFLLHQPLGGVRGQASDITIEAEEILKMRARLIKEIAVETGQPYEKVVADTERNFWMGAEEAVKYGLSPRSSSAAPVDSRECRWPRRRRHGGAAPRSIRSMSAASATAMATGRATSPA